MRVLGVYRNCDRGHAIGHLLTKPKPQLQHEGLNITRDAGPTLQGLGSVADDRCSSLAGQGFGPGPGVEILCLNRVRIQITTKRRLL